MEKRLCSMFCSTTVVSCTVKVKAPTQKPKSRLNKWLLADVWFLDDDTK